MNVRAIISRQGLLTTVLIATTGVAIGLTVTQRTPTEIAPFVDVVLDTLSIQTILATLGGFLLGAILLRLIRSPVKSASNTEIVTSTPESPLQKSVPQLRDSQLMSPFDLETWFRNNPTNDNRQYAMYGRRIEDELTIPTELESIIEELSITARDTYATVHNCSTDEAATKIADGTWTDRRTVATFLATDIDADTDGFTIRERAMGWIFTESVIDRRIAEIMDCINEMQQDEYLSERVAGEEARK